MGNKALSMQLIRSIIQLLEKGYSYRSIATELKVNRKPVTTYCKKLILSGHPLTALRQLSDTDLAAIVYSAPKEQDPEENLRRREFDFRLEYFLSELNRTGVTRLLLWQEYRIEYPAGYGYTQFCILLKEALSIAKPSMR